MNLSIDIIERPQRDSFADDKAMERAMRFVYPNVRGAALVACRDDMRAAITAAFTKEGGAA